MCVCPWQKFCQWDLRFSCNFLSAVHLSRDPLKLDDSTPLVPTRRDATLAFNFSSLGAPWSPLFFFPSSLPVFPEPRNYSVTAVASIIYQDEGPSWRFSKTTATTVIAWSRLANYQWNVPEVPETFFDSTREIDQTALIFWQVVLSLRIWEPEGHDGQVIGDLKYIC